MIILGGKSLSKIGKDLDGQKYFTKNESERQQPSTRRNLEKRIHREFVKISRQHVANKPTFETVNRQVKSPFIIRNTKDTNQTRCNPIYKLVEPHSQQYKFSQTQTKHQFDPVDHYEGQSPCRRSHSSTDRLQVKENNYKSLHHLDFAKQSPRKAYPQQNATEHDPQLRFNNYQSLTLDTKGRPFSSYTKRKELFNKTAHPIMVNLRDYDTHLLRKGWNPQSTVAFDKLKGKVRMRSDRKFQERVSDIQRKNTMDRTNWRQKSMYLSQTDRKPNEVKSQYHFRMCL